MSRTFLSLCVSLTLLACNVEMELGSSDDALIGATPETQHPAVFYTLSGGGGLCTATLIAPRVVTTAKHCVCNAGGILSPQQVRVFSGATINSGTEYAAVQNITAPNPTRCGPAFDNEDFALLTLATAGSLTPYEPIVDDEDVPAVGSTLINIGYGSKYSGYRNNQLPPGATGEKRIRESRLFDVLPMEVIIDGPGPVACFGDSGGPVFSADMKQLGVTSRGDETCTSVSIYSKLAAHRQLIQDAFDATGATMPSDTMPSDPPSNEPPTPPEDPTPIPPEDPTPPPAEVIPEDPTQPPAPEDPAPLPEEPMLPNPEPPPGSTLEEGAVLYGNGCSAATGHSGVASLLCMLGLLAVVRRRTKPS